MARKKLVSKIMLKACMELGITSDKILFIRPVYFTIINVGIIPPENNIVKIKSHIRTVLAQNTEEGFESGYAISMVISIPNETPKNTLTLEIPIACQNSSLLSICS